MNPRNGILLLASAFLLVSCSSNEDKMIQDDLTLSDSAPVRLTSEYSFGTGRIPKGAMPGQCFAKVIIPPKYKTSFERVMVTPEQTRYRKIPAKLAYFTRREKVADEETWEMTLHETQRLLRKRIKIKEGEQVQVVVPAKYKNVSKRIKVQDSTAAWKKSDPRGSSLEKKALCLVKRPAVYKTVKQRMVVEQERLENRMSDPTYSYKVERVPDLPEERYIVTMPAIYEDVNYSKVIEPVRYEKYQAPAKYRQINKKIKVADSRIEWQEVICKTNENRQTISSVQRALRKAGYFRGAIDGNLGLRTAGAVKRFQRRNGLPTGGLTIETVKQLNVDPESM